MTNFLIFFLGVIFGMILSLVLVCIKKEDGNFIVDKLDSEKTVWKLDVNFEPEEITNKKKVIFKVYVQDE